MTETLDRRIHISGVPNFRSLDGFPAESGTVIPGLNNLSATHAAATDQVIHAIRTHFVAVS